MQGLHLLADLHDCTGRVPLDDVRALRTLCVATVDTAGLVAVGELFHPFIDGRGAPLGVTGVVLLAESHLAIHTWPERRAVTLDVYVCNFGTDNAERAEQVVRTLVEAFSPARPAIRRVRRGD
jgi:S-adenosylmethionine decarboxylase proenzyme